MTIVDYRAAKKILRRIALHGLPEGDFGRPWSNPMHQFNLKHNAETAVYHHDAMQDRKAKLKRMVRGQQVESAASGVGRSFWHDGERLGNINAHGSFFVAPDDAAYMREDLAYIMENRVFMSRENRWFMLEGLRDRRRAIAIHK